MHATISTQTKTELLDALRQRYQQASRPDKAKILDEFVALAGCHRKHAIRLLRRAQGVAPQASPVAQRVYDEAQAKLALLAPKGARTVARAPTTHSI